VDTPWQPFEGDDDRSLIEDCCIKEGKQQWSIQHPPHKTAWAVRVHVIFTVRMFALGTVYRLQREQAAIGNEPGGWQRWRRQLLEQTRDHVIVFAPDCYGIFHMAAYALLLGVKLKDVPPTPVRARKFPPNVGSQPMARLLRTSVFKHPLSSTFALLSL
jgi:hypothetical protein